MASRRKWDCSAIVFIEGGSVIAEDSAGGVIRQAPAGTADAAVVQAAIDKVHPTGMIRLCAGTYSFEKPVIIYNSSTLAGEGRATVIRPPSDDYAFKVMTIPPFIEPFPGFTPVDPASVPQTAGKTEIFRPYHGVPGPLFAVIVRDLMIDGLRDDGKKKGKGLYLGTFWSSTFENLWISDTANAIYIRHVKECDFSNIYLIANGDEKTKQASVIMTGENNNLHFRGLYVVYSNYVGLDMIGTKAEGIEVPRLIFITQSMFHGWLRESGAATYDQIRIADLDAHRKGCLADVVIRDSRITVAGPGQSALNVINSPVTVSNCVMTATAGKYVVRAVEGARVTVTANTFHGGNPDANEYALYASDAEVIFKDNVMNGTNLNVCLAPASNSIIADNKFVIESDKPSVWIGDDGKTGCANVEVHGNMFAEKRAKSAVRVSPLSRQGINVHDNHFAGNYDGPATD